MNSIHFRPDYLRFTPELRKDLETLAYYEPKKRLKVTEQGFVRVSRVHSLFQSFKGKLGFTNYCSSTRVNYHARKLLYEVTLTGNEPFSDLLETIQNNQSLTNQFRRIHDLLSNNTPNLKVIKSDLTRDYMEMRPSFWRRRFSPRPPFDPYDFGKASLDLVLQSDSMEKGLEHLSRVLKMDLDNELIATNINNCLWRFLRNKTIHNNLKPMLAEIEMRITYAQISCGYTTNAHKTNQHIIQQLVLKDWPPLLVRRLFNHLLICCNDIKGFINFYQKAQELGFSRKDYTIKFIEQAMIPDLPIYRQPVFELALADANPEDITAEFAHCMLDSSPALPLKLRNYFLLRQKAPEAIVGIDPPWNAITEANEAWKLLSCCVTEEDQLDLKAHYHRLNHGVADRILNSISLLDTALFQANGKRNQALDLYRITFKNGKDSEFQLSWIKPYMGLLKFMQLKEELNIVIKRVLEICASRQQDIPLFEYVLSWYKSICITEEDKKKFQAFYHRLNHQIALKELESITLWQKVTLQAAEVRTKALALLRTTFEKGEDQEFEVSWIKPYMELLQFMEQPKELETVFNKVLRISITRQQDTSLFEYITSWIDQNMVAEHAELLGNYLEQLPVNNQKKLELLEQVLAKGVHHHLFFLKGEWLPENQLDRRLLAYRWAYTLGPWNPLDKSNPYYNRTLLKDDQLKAPEADVLAYRKCALNLTLVAQ